MLQHIRYTRYNTTPGSLQTLNEQLLNMNKVIFCSESNELVIPYQHCSILVPNDYYVTYSLLYVPCNMPLPHAGYVCEKREIQQEVFIPVLALLDKRGNDQNLQISDRTKDFRKYSELFRSISSIVSLFKCIDKTLLPNYYVCDGTNDCPDGGDEANCSDVCSYHRTNQTECFTSCQ